MSEMFSELIPLKVIEFSTNLDQRLSILPEKMGKKNEYSPMHAFASLTCEEKREKENKLL